MVSFRRQLVRMCAARIVVAALSAGVVGAVSFAAPDGSLSTPMIAGSGTTQSHKERYAVGHPKLIDGDTFDVAGHRIRLEGIDAPERAQFCARGPIGARLDAGQLATKALGGLIGQGTVRCRLLRKDGYGRHIATCWNADGQEINRAMVERGAAWAFLKYSTTYEKEEATARDRRVGIWSAHCMRAALYRTDRWRRNAQSAPQGCPIKGNISRSGRVYHMPWSAWYDRTTIDERRGERWFCSEDEALKAGWRPATG